MQRASLQWALAFLHFNVTLSTVIFFYAGRRPLLLIFLLILCTNLLVIERSKLKLMDMIVDYLPIFKIMCHLVSVLLR